MPLKNKGLKWAKYSYKTTCNIIRYSEDCDSLSFPPIDKYCILLLDTLYQFSKIEIASFNEMIDISLRKKERFVILNIAEILCKLSASYFYLSHNKKIDTRNLNLLEAVISAINSAWVFILSMEDSQYYWETIYYDVNFIKEEQNLSIDTFIDLLETHFRRQS